MKLIPNTDNFAVSPSGRVFNLKLGKPLKRYWHPERQTYYSNVRTRSGKRVRFYHDREEAEVVSDAIALPEDAQPVEGHPHYFVTPYGAVWSSGGGRNHRPRMLRETLKYGSPYVQITTKFGKRTWISVRKAVRDAFGHEDSVVLGGS